MAYTEITIPVIDEMKDIVLAELHELGFEGIWDKGNELSAYILTDLFSHKQLYDTLAKYKMENHFNHQLVPDQNWNKEWEKHYDPVYIDDRVYIRSPFHEPKSSFRHELIIQPQMSFGTGHHQTTRMMVEMMLTMDFKNKSILDMGTGTGVLAIFSSILGASKVIGVDNDENSVENANQNLKYNKVNDVTFLHGSHETIPTESFDIILSNITKNINLSLLPHLVEKVSVNGYLVLAGFLNFDLDEMDRSVKEFSFKIKRNISLGDWECLLYQKQQTY
jgi:ribosomal protein L11 methyltransferase